MPEHITYAIKMVEIARIRKSLLNLKGDPTNEPVGQVIDVQFLPGRPPSTPEQVKKLDRSLEDWKQGLTDELGRGVEDGTASVWSHLLHLAYKSVAYHHIWSLLMILATYES
jgi:hypothetical protein